MAASSAGLSSLWGRRCLLFVDPGSVALAALGWGVSYVIIMGDLDGISPLANPSTPNGLVCLSPYADMSPTPITLP
jgi:hypothetical protein